MIAAAMAFSVQFTTAALLVTTAWSLPPDQGPPTFAESIQTSPKQQYREVVMYLTPSQIRTLEANPEYHQGMILPTAQPLISLQEVQQKQHQASLEQASLQQALDQQHAKQTKTQQSAIEHASLKQALQQQLAKDASNQQILHHALEQQMNKEVKMQQAALEQDTFHQALEQQAAKEAKIQRANLQQVSLHQALEQHITKEANRKQAALDQASFQEALNQQIDKETKQQLASLDQTASLQQTLEHGITEEANRHQDQALQQAFEHQLDKETNRQNLATTLYLKQNQTKFSQEEKYAPYRQESGPQLLLNSQNPHIHPQGEPISHGHVFYLNVHQPSPTAQPQFEHQLFLPHQHDQILQHVQTHNLNIHPGQEKFVYSMEQALTQKVTPHDLKQIFFPELDFHKMIQQHQQQKNEEKLKELVSPPANANFHFVPYEYVPSQQEEHQKLGAQILQNVLQEQPEENPNKRPTHLDIIKQQEYDARPYQYASNYNDQTFFVNNAIMDFQNEKKKAERTIEAIAKSPPTIIQQDVTITKHRPVPVDLIKTVKVPAPYLVPYPQPYKVNIPQPYAVPYEIIKPYGVPIVRTEKVEVEKPVPVEVEKHVQVEVEKKVYVRVNKPYTVERFVPFQVKKEIPYEVPLYKPKKLTILRHVWQH